METTYSEAIQSEVGQTALRDRAVILQRYCHGLAHESGWWKDKGGIDVRLRDDGGEFLNIWVAAKLALVHTEVSEGVEGFRKGKMDDHLPHRKMLEVELADAIIRIFDLAGGLNLDVPGAIAEKLAYNANRADHKPENRAKAGGKAF